MMIPPYLAAITEEIDGVKQTELIHEMTEIRLRDIIQRRTEYNGFYYSRDVRSWAANELERREKNSLIVQAQDDFEFRQEVINNMIAAGVSEAVALAMTSSPGELLKQAKRYEVI